MINETNHFNTYILILGYVLCTIHTGCPALELLDFRKCGPPSSLVGQPGYSGKRLSHLSEEYWVLITIFELSSNGWGEGQGQKQNKKWDLFEDFSSQWTTVIAFLWRYRAKYCVFHEGNVIPLKKHFFLGGLFEKQLTHALIILYSLLEHWRHYLLILHVFSFFS